MTTKHIRIAVVVDSEGSWSATGWDTRDEEHLMDAASEGLDSLNPHLEYWVEATLEMPKRKMVVGREYPNSVSEGQ